MTLTYNDYSISDDPTLLKYKTIHELLNRTYWADERSFQEVEDTINHSLCFGIYQGECQVGFARVITDYTTMYYLCDVVIDENHRAAGLGKKLVESILANPKLRHLKGILATADAHTFYEKYGFVIENNKFMTRYID